MRGQLPSVELYRLVHTPAPDGNAGPGPAPALTEPAAAGGIAVVPYVTAGVYGGHQLVYRVEGAGYGTYPNREWALPLRDELGRLTERVLQAAPVTEGHALFDPASRRHFAYVWHGSVQELEEVNRGKSVFVAVALGAQLVRVQDDSVVWSGSRRLERAVQEPTMPAIVAALSATASEVIRELANEARSAIRPP